MKPEGHHSTMSASAGVRKLCLNCPQVRQQTTRWPMFFNMTFRIFWGLIPFPFFPTILLFSKTVCFPWSFFDGLLKRFGSLESEWTWKVSLEIWLWLQTLVPPHPPCFPFKMDHTESTNRLPKEKAITFWGHDESWLPKLENTKSKG